MKVRMWATKGTESVALQLPTYWDGGNGEVYVPVSIFSPGTVIKVDFEKEDSDYPPFNKKEEK